MSPSAFDRLTRRAALAGGATVAGLAAIRPLGGSRGSAAQESSPVASPGAEPEIAPDAEFLFVQVAPDATWTPKAGVDGAHTLTLTHRSGESIYFSDRPERVVGTIATARLIRKLGFDADPPNAAIVAADQALIVELTNPVYDAEAGMLAYDATPLVPEQASAGLGHLANRQSAAQSDAALPENLGETSLFIDSGQAEGLLTCGEAHSCHNSTGVVGGIPGGPYDLCWDWQDCHPCDPLMSMGQLNSLCNNNYPDACRDDYCYAEEDDDPNQPS